MPSQFAILLQRPGALVSSVSSKCELGFTAWRSDARAVSFLGGCFLVEPRQIIPFPEDIRV